MPENNNFTSLSVTFRKTPGLFPQIPSRVVFSWQALTTAMPTSGRLQMTHCLPDPPLPTETINFNLSHVCPGVSDYEELTVSKTAVTSFTREHFWDIDKSVDTENGYEHEGYPKVWLYIDGSGDETATWTVDVTYEGYVDSLFNVSGVITIENTGTLDAVITDIDRCAGWHADHSHLRRRLQPCCRRDAHLHLR
jgi:hypothetical protein